MKFSRTNKIIAVVLVLIILFVGAIAILNINTVKTYLSVKMYEIKYNMDCEVENDVKRCENKNLPPKIAKLYEEFKIANAKNYQYSESEKFKKMPADESYGKNQYYSYSYDTRKYTCADGSRAETYRISSIGYIEGTDEKNIVPAGRGGSSLEVFVCANNAFIDDSNLSYGPAIYGPVDLSNY